MPESPTPVSLLPAPVAILFDWHGTLVDTSGRVLGEHAGTEHFTVGQRRGHGVGGGVPLYVVAVLPETGTVVLGTRAECAAPTMNVGQLNWIGFTPPTAGPFRCAVQVRYHHRAAPCEVELSSAGEALVTFDQPQLAIAPGQGAAFYDGDLLLGGGWIAGAGAAAPQPAEESVERA